MLKDSQPVVSMLMQARMPNEPICILRLLATVTGWAC